MSEIKATIYYAEENKEPLEIKPANGKSFTLKEMKEIVTDGKGNDMVEHALLAGDGLPTLSVLCNEDGKMLGLPVNIKASLIWKKYYRGAAQFLVGNVLICDPKLIK